MSGNVKASATPAGTSLTSGARQPQSTSCSASPSTRTGRGAAIPTCDWNCRIPWDEASCCRHPYLPWALPPPLGCVHDKESPNSFGSRRFYAASMYRRRLEEATVQRRMAIR